jgi:hypothetical protein
VGVAHPIKRMKIHSPLGRGDCRRQAGWVSVIMAFPIYNPPLAFGRPLRRRGFLEHEAASVTWRKSVHRGSKRNCGLIAP